MVSNLPGDQINMILNIYRYWGWGGGYKQISDKG